MSGRRVRRLTLPYICCQTRPICQFWISSHWHWNRRGETVTIWWKPCSLIISITAVANLNKRTSYQLNCSNIIPFRLVILCIILYCIRWQTYLDVLEHLHWVLLFSKDMKSEPTDISPVEYHVIETHQELGINFFSRSCWKNHTYESFSIKPASELCFDNWRWGPNI